MPPLKTPLPNANYKSSNFTISNPNFRTSFSYKNKIFWFPQHQSKALQALKKGIHHIDLLVEVRDARIPLTFVKNQDLDFNREKLIIYNKFDLSNPQMKAPILQALKEYRNETNVLFTKADTGVNVKKILEFCVEKCNSDPVRFPFLSIAVVGAPNVGKSTLINGLRKLGMGLGKVTQTGKKAGVTTAIQTRVKIHKDPPVYLFDTPGIFNPHFTQPVEGLKIALTGATNDKLASILNVADYLLFRLNNCPTGQKRKTWPKVVGLDEATDDIYHVATHIARTHNFTLNRSSRLVRLSPDLTQRDKQQSSPGSSLDQSGNIGEQDVYWDLDRACQYMVDLYRMGKFGRMTLDDLGPTAIKEFFEESVKEPEMTKTGYAF